MLRRKAGQILKVFFGPAMNQLGGQRPGDFRVKCGAGFKQADEILKDNQEKSQTLKNCIYSYLYGPCCIMPELLRLP